MKHNKNFLRVISFTLCFSLGAQGAMAELNKDAGTQTLREKQVRTSAAIVKEQMMGLGYSAKQCEKVMEQFSDLELIEMASSPDAFVKMGQASGGAGGGGGAVMAILVVCGLVTTLAAAGSSGSSSGGQTKIIEKTVREVWETCSSCEGKGKCLCTKCNGKGLSQIKDEYGDRLSCDKCGGDGLLSISCSRCGGRGQVKR